MWESGQCELLGSSWSFEYPEASTSGCPPSRRQAPGMIDAGFLPYPVTSYQDTDREQDGGVIMFQAQTLCHMKIHNQLVIRKPKYNLIITEEKKGALHRKVAVSSTRAF